MCTNVILAGVVLPLQEALQVGFSEPLTANVCLMRCCIESINKRAMGGQGVN